MIENFIAIGALIVGLPALVAVLVALIRESNSK